MSHHESTYERRSLPDRNVVLSSELHVYYAQMSVGFPNWSGSARICPTHVADCVLSQGVIAVASPLEAERLQIDEELQKEDVIDLVDEP